MAEWVWEVLLGSWEWNKERFSSTATLCWKRRGQIEGRGFFFTCSYFSCTHYPLGIFWRNYSKHLNCFWLGFSANLFFSLNGILREDRTTWDPTFIQVIHTFSHVSLTATLWGDTVIIPSSKGKLKFKAITCPQSHRKHQNLNSNLSSLTSEPAYCLPHYIIIPLSCINSFFLSCPPDIVV